MAIYTLLVLCLYITNKDSIKIIILLLIAPFPYSIILGICNDKREKKLFHGIESKMRYMNDIIRKQYEDESNIFGRCIIVESATLERGKQLIWIIPQLPRYLYLIDYNGNCINALGNYVEASMIYNFAPYNEIAEGLAQEGYIVARLDMLSGNRQEDSIANCVKGITAWNRRIQKEYGVVDDPIVIGHRENGGLAIELMKLNQWKKGILLCCGINYNYLLEGKSCFESLKDLTGEYTIVQIDSGSGENRSKRKEDADSLSCQFTVHKIDNMDYSLRTNLSVSKKIFVEKGYGTKCGSGEFPPVCEKLMNDIKKLIANDCKMEYETINIGKGYVNEK